MALIGPAPTIAHVSSLVRSKSGDELFELLEEVIQFTTGPILTNLAANEISRKKLATFLTPEKLKEVFPDLRSSSDPYFVALSWLADECTELRSPIVDLITSDDPQKEALTVLTRLLASNKLDTKSLSDESVDQILMWCLAVNVEDDGEFVADHWQGLATIVAKACSQSHKEHILDYIRSNKDDPQGYAAAAACSDTISEVKDIVWTMKPSDDPTFFKLLSVLCNDKDDRMNVSKHFKDIIEKGSGTDLQAAVVYAKLLAGSTSQTENIEQAAAKLDDLSLKFENEVNEVSLEGLACTAMLPAVRKRASKALITSLAALLKAKPAQTAFPVTAVLEQLARYPVRIPEMKSKQNNLRIQALGKSVFDSNEELLQTDKGLADAKAVSAQICDLITESGVLNWYTLNGTRLSMNTRKQLALLLRELTAHQQKSRKRKLADQGAVVIAMYLWTEKRPQQLDAPTRVVAASAVARILISIEPQAALTAKVNKLHAVVPLCELLDNHENSSTPDLDTFEGLLALTNLASIDDRPLRVDISRKVWAKMGNCLNSDSLLIRRSALELVCNLMLVPQSAQHFLQGNNTSRALLSVLGTNVVCEDRDSRLAAAGALAILAEWETAAEQIGRNAECIEGLSRAMGLFANDDDLLVRVLTALKTIIKVTTSDMDDEVAERIIFFEGMAYLEELVDTLDPIVHKEVAKLVLQCVHLLAQYKVKNI